MLNALEIYNKINSYRDIQTLIGVQEDLFLDFKTSATTDGSLTLDDKNNFKEAISGFAHQEGGVIIWGIDCRVNPNTGTDEAISEKSIINVGDFQKRFGDFFPYTTEPLVDGVLSKIILVNDDTSGNVGFLIHFIPKSYKAHRVLNPKKSIIFYKRYGASFRPVESTEEIRSLFFRQFSPELEVEVSLRPSNENEVNFQFSLRNKGVVSAKYIAIFISVLPIHYYDGGGNERWGEWTQVLNGDGTRTFLLNNGLALHPEQISKVFLANGHFPASNPNVKPPESFEYIVYAENMEPLKGKVSLK